MASTAALSAAFSSPRPRKRAAAMAAASVTRATSSTKTRSSTPATSWPCMVSDIAHPLLALFPAAAVSQRLDSYHLGALRYIAILADRRQRAADRFLGGFVGDENNRRRRARTPPCGNADLCAGRTLLDDALKRHPALAHAAGDAGHGARAVEHGQAHVIRSEERRVGK